jgi:hypothetical protein
VHVISLVLPSKTVFLLDERVVGRGAERSTEFVTLKRRTGTAIYVSSVSLALPSKPVCLSGGRAVGRRDPRGLFS